MFDMHARKNSLLLTNRFSFLTIQSLHEGAALKPNFKNNHPRTVLQILFLFRCTVRLIVEQNISNFSDIVDDEINPVSRNQAVPVAIKNARQYSLVIKNCVSYDNEMSNKFTWRGNTRIY